MVTYSVLRTINNTTYIVNKSILYLCNKRKVEKLPTTEDEYVTRAHVITIF
jgi:hypothetical protein